MIFIKTLFNNPVFFILVVLAVVPSICIHEYAHAQIAVWNGDQTPAEQGHLTLNPLKQMGIMSIVMFLLLGIAWGSVPINRYNLTRKGRILSVVAGPCANFALFVLAWLLLFLLAGSPVPVMLKNYFYVLGMYNAVLMLFNLIPAPGLDGWLLLNEIFHLPQVRSEFVKGAMFVLIFVAFMGIRYLFMFGSFLMDLSIVCARGV